jgi:hypothetical protein
MPRRSQFPREVQVHVRRGLFRHTYVHSHPCKHASNNQWCPTPSRTPTSSTRRRIVTPKVSPALGVFFQAEAKTALRCGAHVTRGKALPPATGRESYARGRGRRTPSTHSSSSDVAVAGAERVSVLVPHRHQVLQGRGVRARGAGDAGRGAQRRAGCGRSRAASAPLQHAFLTPPPP